MLKNIFLKCGYCGIEFEKNKSEIKRQKKKGREIFFCSLSCGAKHNNLKNKKPLIKKQCPVCGEIFQTSTNKSEKTFCSASCASKGSISDSRRIAMIEGGKKSQKNNPSSAKNIEKVLKKRELWKYKEIIEFLNFMKINHEIEFLLDKRIFDICLIDYNILIEFDGDYHNNYNQIKIDAIKDKIAENNGFKIKRIKTKNNTMIRANLIFKIINDLREVN